MSKEKQIVKKEAAPATIYGEVDKSLLNQLSSAEATDFEFARLTVIQPTSKIKGSWGDVIDSNSNEPIAKMNEKVAFVPLWFFKSYAIYETKPRKWKRNETKTATNATRSVFENREDKEENKPVKWEERINLYLILKKDLNEMIPTVYRLLIKPSSFKEAKKLLMDWEIKKRTGQYPFTSVWNFATTAEENDQGKFAVLQVTKEMTDGKQSQVTAEQFEGVQYWVKTLVENQASIMKVEAKLEEETEAVVADAVSY